MTEFSSQRPEKVNFGMSQDAFEEVKEDSWYYHYHFEFLKHGLVLAEMNAAFDHVLSRHEVVLFLRGYVEVRDEKYDVRVFPPKATSPLELKRMRKEVLDLGMFKMTEKTAQAQEQKDMEAIAKEIVAKCKFNKKQRTGKTVE
jgi:hypothetical protein